MAPFDHTGSTDGIDASYSDFGAAALPVRVCPPVDGPYSFSTCGSSRFKPQPSTQPYPYPNELSPNLNPQLNPDLNPAPTVTSTLTSFPPLP